MGKRLTMKQTYRFKRIRCGRCNSLLAIIEPGMLDVNISPCHKCQNDVYREGIHAGMKKAYDLICEPPTEEKKEEAYKTIFKKVVSDGES